MTFAAKAKVIKLLEDQKTEFQDFLAREEPLEIRVEGKSIAVAMRTPGHDQELAAGFLVTEGLIKKKSDIFEISQCPSQTDPENNLVDVLLKKGLKIDFSSLTRHVFSSSSCGVCGKATIESVFQNFPPIQSNITVKTEIIKSLPDKLRKAQKTFQFTGGLHASGLFDLDGNLLVLREDVGRHNALDKVIGYALLNNLLPLNKNILLVSGRISFEIVQKALAASIPIICAISAPSSLAVSFAQQSGQTLIGFLRGDTMNLYTHSDRIIY